MFKPGERYRVATTDDPSDEEGLYFIDCTVIEFASPLLKIEDEDKKEKIFNVTGPLFLSAEKLND